MQRGSIAGKPRPMSLERKRDAFGHANGRKHTPPGEQTNLPRREHPLRCLANVLIVKNEPVEHEFILARGGERKWTLIPASYTH